MSRADDHMDRKFKLFHTSNIISFTLLLKFIYIVKIIQENISNCLNNYFK